MSVTHHRKDSTRAQPKEWWTGAQERLSQCPLASWNPMYPRVQCKAFEEIRQSNGITTTGGAKSLEQLRQGDRVKLQPFTPGQREWVDGQVVKEIQAGGKVYIRNRRHLRKYEPNEDVEPAAEPPVPQISMQASPALETVEQAPRRQAVITRNLTSPWRQRIPNS